MLTKIGKFVEKRPWLVIIIILLITVGFGTLLPALDMNTSMEDFLPDNEVVNANYRVNDYFGAGFNVVMILVENQQAKSRIT